MEMKFDSVFLCSEKKKTDSEFNFFFSGKNFPKRDYGFPQWKPDEAEFKKSILLLDIR